jgi:DNA-directed RNA polymerase subunit RPC12/RpoP
MKGGTLRDWYYGCSRCGKELKIDSDGLFEGRSTYCKDCRQYEPKPACITCGKELKEDSDGRVKDCHCDDCLRRHPELLGTGVSMGAQLW